MARLDAVSVSGAPRDNHNERFHLDSYSLVGAVCFNDFLPGGIGGQRSGVHEDVGLFQRQLE